MASSSLPTSELELNIRCNHLAGMTLGEIARSLQEKIPSNLNSNKGWVGQLIEKALGVATNNIAGPDFANLGIELKTISLKSNNQPKESVYICTAPILINSQNMCWESSLVKRKLNKVLWVPLEACNSIELAHRKIGAPTLWQPTINQEQDLKTDWEELTDMLMLGEIDKLSAHYGKYLQIRPKAANNKETIANHGLSDNPCEYQSDIVPRGFYLRTKFIKEVLESCYAA